MADMTLDEVYRQVFGVDITSDPDRKLPVTPEEVDRFCVLMKPQAGFVAVLIQARYGTPAKSLHPKVQAWVDRKTT